MRAQLSALRVRWRTRRTRLVTGRLDDPRMAGIHQIERFYAETQGGSWHGSAVLITGYQRPRVQSRERAWILLW